MKMELISNGSGVFLVEVQVNQGLPVSIFVLRLLYGISICSTLSLTPIHHDADLW